MMSLRSKNHGAFVARLPFDCFEVGLSRFWSPDGADPLVVCLLSARFRSSSGAGDSKL